MLKYGRMYCVYWKIFLENVRIKYACIYLYISNTGITYDADGPCFEETRRFVEGNSEKIYDVYFFCNIAFYAFDVSGM